MTDAQTVAILGSIITTLVTIIGYFLHRLITGIDKGLSELKEEVRMDTKLIKESIDHFKNESIRISNSIVATQNTVQYLTKSIDELKKLNGLIMDLSNRLTATETKIDNFGKIVFLEKKKH